MRQRPARSVFPACVQTLRRRWSRKSLMQETPSPGTRLRQLGLVLVGGNGTLKHFDTPSKDFHNRAGCGPPRSQEKSMPTVALRERSFDIFALRATNQVGRHSSMSEEIQGNHNAVRI